MGITITLILIIMTGLISYQAFSNPDMKRKLLFHPYTVKNNSEYFRFLTSGFVHLDMTHLLINMFVLYMFGEVLERQFDAIFDAPLGRLYFLALYLGSIIFGCLPSFFKHQNNSYYSALGASGGTSGIVLAFCLFYPWTTLYIMFILPCPAIVAAVLYLAYSTWAAKNANDNIGHDAHLWGALFGFGFTLALLFLLRADVLPIIWERITTLPIG